ncbi:hypothetical protein EXIGLDRAFT_795506, partial [Exidia glandulosa HHB12029]
AWYKLAFDFDRDYHLIASVDSDSLKRNACLVHITQSRRRWSDRLAHTRQATVPPPKTDTHSLTSNTQRCRSPHSRRRLLHLRSAVRLLRLRLPRSSPRRRLRRPSRVLPTSTSRPRRFAQALNRWTTSGPQARRWITMHMLALSYQLDSHSPRSPTSAPKRQSRTATRSSTVGRAKTSAPSMRSRLYISPRLRCSRRARVDCDANGRVGSASRSSRWRGSRGRRGRRRRGRCLRTRGCARKAR